MRNSIVKITSALLGVALMSGAMMQPAVAMQDGEPNRAGSVSSSASTASGTTSTATGTGSFSGSSKVSFGSMQKAIKEYQQTNTDVKGWLIVPGTNINEPVLYSNKDNSYYANRDWKGTNFPNNNWKNFVYTAAYLDFRTKFADSWSKSSKNSVIYGHNWTNLRQPLAIGSENNHTMFGQLPSYTDLTWASNHPYIYYSTGENEGVWKVFSVAYCELKDTFKYNMPNPGTDDFVKLVQEWKARSLFNFDVDVTTTDRILTLSTCTRMYNQGANQRFVVVARLLRDNESDSSNTVNVTVNPNVKNPQF